MPFHEWFWLVLKIPAVLDADADLLTNLQIMIYSFISEWFRVEIHCHKWR